MRSESWKCYAVFVAFSSSTCRLISFIVDYGIFNMATSCVNVFNPVLSKPKATRERKAEKTKNYIKIYPPVLGTKIQRQVCVLCQSLWRDFHHQCCLATVDPLNNRTSDVWDHLHCFAQVLSLTLLVLLQR